MPKTVFITGASRGLGQVTKQFFYDNSYQVIAPTRSDMDLSSEKSITEYISSINPKVDILINNAGMNEINKIEDLSFAKWNEILHVNLHSAFLLTKHLSLNMKKNNWGRILNIASCFALVTKEGRSAYTASKAALIGLTKTSALELAPNNILVNALCPGFITTEMTFKNNNPEQLRKIAENIPLSRLAKPDELLGIIEYLCSERNTYLTGQEIIVDGGFMLR